MKKIENNQVSVDIKTLKRFLLGKSPRFVFLESIELSKKNQEVVFTFSENLLEKGYTERQIEFFSKELEDLDMSVRLNNHLKAFGGIKTAKDIMANAGEIKETPVNKFSAKSKRELKALFKEYKLIIDL